jgi:hypothetical protein
VNRMRMDAEKGQAATEWKAPGKLKRYKYSWDLQSSTEDSSGTTVR